MREGSFDLDVSGPHPFIGSLLLVFYCWSGRAAIRLNGSAGAFAELTKLLKLREEFVIDLRGRRLEDRSPALRDPKISAPCYLDKATTDQMPSCSLPK
jgi:hypothetical protein